MRGSNQKHRLKRRSEKHPLPRTQPQPYPRTPLLRRHLPVALKRLPSQMMKTRPVTRPMRLLKRILGVPVRTFVSSRKRIKRARLKTRSRLPPIRSLLIADYLTIMTSSRFRCFLWTSRRWASANIGALRLRCGSSVSFRSFRIPPSTSS